MADEPRILHVKVEVEPSEDVKGHWTWDVIINGMSVGKGSKPTRDEADQEAIQALHRWRRDQSSRN
jgi:dsRNA-specific ribonuclease